MRFLCIMDPLAKLDPEWDNSLALLAELRSRGHEAWMADVPEVWAEKNSVWGICHKLVALSKSNGQRIFRLDQFDRIFIRKEPPFNEAYLNLTYLLEKIAAKVPVINHPRGIRNTNEKLSILHFPQWIPETIVSHSTEHILDFQKRLKAPIVVKPLDQKGGYGVFLLHKPSSAAVRRLNKATHGGQKALMAQRFIDAKKKIEKRIVILNGELFALYEKRPLGREFRANLGLGGTFHVSKASAQERQLVRDLRPYLLKEGLYFAGIDVLNEKLLEINVTCPAGVTEAKFLYPQAGHLQAAAAFLEDFPKHSARPA